MARQFVTGTLAVLAGSSRCVNASNRSPAFSRKNRSTATCPRPLSARSNEILEPELRKRVGRYLENQHASLDDSYRTCSPDDRLVWPRGLADAVVNRLSDGHRPG